MIQTKRKESHSLTQLKNDYISDILFDTKKYIETYFNIRSKERKIIPFILNDIQNDYIKYRSNRGGQGRGQRDAILKARQHGFTTLKAGEYLHDCIINEGVTSVIVGHDDDAMQRVLENVRLMYYSIPEQDRPAIKYDNKEELYFPELNSRYYISTFRKLKLQSQTINNLLMTEVAFWKTKNAGELVAAMTESVPLDGNICYESTPKGVGGHFWKVIQNAKNGSSIYKLFIYPWFVNKEYIISKDDWYLLPDDIRPVGSNLKLDQKEEELIEKWSLSLEQIMWRRYKMVSLEDMRVTDNGIRQSRRFSQQYSCEFAQSGHTVFDSSYLIPKTRFKKPKKEGKYIHGADTSEGVEDGNFNVLYTMNFETGEVVNKIRGLWKPREFAIRIHKIGMEYGGLIGIESNNTGHAVLLKLAELFEEEAISLDEKAQEAYDKVRNTTGKEFDKVKKEAGLDIYDRIPYRIYSDKKKLGWNTNALSRKSMFIEGEEALRDGSIKLAIEDEEGLEELIACQYNDNMKEEAPEGMFDDSVMALLICYQMRKYYQFYFDKSGIEMVITSH